MLHYAGPPTIGGVEATIAAHARVMVADDRRVRIIAGSGAAPAPGIKMLESADLRSRGDEVERVANELAQGTVGPAFEQLTARIAEFLSAALAGVDVAIVHNLLSLHKNLAFTAALHRLHRAGTAPRLLAWCHDMAWLDPLYIPTLHNGYPWNLLREPWPGVRYVVVSHDRRAMLADLLDLPAEQIAVATPGVDLAAFLKLETETVTLIERFDLLHAEPLLLLPARITRRKNIEQAIGIVGALRQLGLRPRLVVTGPLGPHNPSNAAYLSQLQTIQRESGAGDSVVFLYEALLDRDGRPRTVSDAMVADLYKLADALLMPSRAEGFGMPIVEAGLAGLPIICSDIEPFRETAGDATLRFSPDAPPAEIAAQIARALRDDLR
ncbi:MAG TPA: glycosyltransferase, partial [Roseiflexaceae bacterium]|nr:glycosyltransferase [Roseiflexaceae bacterium]